MGTETLGDPTERTAGKRWGCLLYSLSALAVIALVAGMTYLIWYANAKSELDDAIGRIQDRGEPLWFADMASREPPHPENDATPLFLAAIAKLKPLNRAFYDRLEANETTPAQYPELAAGLQLNRPALDLLAQALSRPYFRLPIDYETKRPFHISLDPIQESRTFARLLEAETIRSVGAGDQARAVEAVMESLKLSELMRDEPFIVTQLVRYAIGAVAIQSLDRVIERIQLTPQQSAAIDDQLERMSTDFRIAPSLLAERCAAFTTMQYLAENQDTLGGTAENGKQWSRMSRFLTARPVRPYLYHDQAYMLRIMTEAMDAVDVPGEPGSSAMASLDSRLRGDTARSHVLTRLLFPAISTFRGAALRFRQRLLNARLAIRIARYRSEHGELPKTLADILDEKLATAVDVYTGQPLVYELNSEGFVLYPTDDSLQQSTPAGQKPEVAKQVNTFEAKFSHAERQDQNQGDRP